jgi:ABC-type amino acid transport substrate-binding protein
VILESPDAKPLGLTVALVESLGKTLGRPIEWRPMGFSQVLEAVTKGEVDFAAAAISVTAERERVMDFSHPFLTTGLGIAVRTQPAGGVGSMVEALTSRAFLEAVGALALLLSLVGLCVWLFERKSNREHFGGSVLGGIGNGFWWSAVTMSTVGYGDKVPRTAAGRILGVIWMFASVILISSFTAAIASGLTVNRLEGAVSGPRDLPRVKVATVRNTAAARYLDNQKLRFIDYPDLSAAIEGLARREADALVYDAPLLSYQCAQRPAQDLKVLDAIFARQTYAIALPVGSPLRKPLNEALLSILASTVWLDELSHWFPEH